MFEDHAFEECLDDALFFFREAGDSLELEFEVVRRGAFRFVEQQLVGGYDAVLFCFSRKKNLR